MVDQSREDYEKMKSLLQPQEVEEEGSEENEVDDPAEMSDFERRLEEKEKKKGSKTKDEEKEAKK